MGESAASGVSRDFLGDRFQHRVGGLGASVKLRGSYEDLVF